MNLKAIKYIADLIGKACLMVVFACWFGVIDGNFYPYLLGSIVCMAITVFINVKDDL